MPTPIARLPAGIVARSGASVFLVPWIGHKTTTGTWARGNSITALSGGTMNNAGAPAQNDAISWDVWLDSGTYKVAMVIGKDTNSAIITVQFNGVSQGTIDGFNVGGVLENQYTEITGIVVTAGVKTVNLVAATKNGSSSSYKIVLYGISLIRTGP